MPSAGEGTRWEAVKLVMPPVLLTSLPHKAYSLWERGWDRALLSPKPGNDHLQANLNGVPGHAERRLRKEFRDRQRHLDDRGESGAVVPAGDQWPDRWPGGRLSSRDD